MKSSLVDIFEALGSPPRLAIVMYLVEQEAPVSAGEVVAEVGGSAGNVSKGLTQLRRAGIIHLEQQGRKRMYASSVHTRELLEIAKKLIVR